LKKRQKRNAEKTERKTIRLEPGLSPDIALSALRNDPDWMFKLGMGAVIDASGFVLLSFTPAMLPLAFCLFALTTGYVMRVANSAAKTMAANGDSYSLPEWSNWLDLFVSGLTWVAIATGQLIILLLALSLSLSLGGATGSAFPLSHSFRLWWSVSIALITLLAASISFFSSYLFVNLAIQEKLSAAFNLAKVMRKAGLQPQEMALAWLLNIGLLYAAVFIPMFSVVGVFFLPLCFFSAQILGALVLAQAWQRETNIKEEGKTLTT
jgi:hypothetical protein